MSTSEAGRASAPSHGGADRRVPVIGVLLVNLGTPRSPSVRDVRRYLREFLSDPRVVEVNRVLWWLVLNGVILPRRAARSAHAYAQVWTVDGSPLLAFTRKQATGLSAALGPGYAVEAAMRYGSPSIASGVDALCARGCERIVLLSAFPQYSSSTSGSVYAEVYRQLALRRNQPALTIVPPYFDDTRYVRALATRIRESDGASRVQHWIFSFHGLPQRYVDRGDPYRAHCASTAEALARELGLERARWSLAFQSRFGREPWLQPYVDELAPKLARGGDVLGITTPGFTADCLETIEEIGLRLRADVRRAGGPEFVVVPCLNDHPAWIEALAELVRRAAPPAEVEVGLRAR